MLTAKERENLGAKIWLARDTLHYSRDDVMMRSKYTLNKNDLSYFERGMAWSKNPEKLKALCNVLGLNFEEFKVLLETAGPEIHPEQFTLDDMVPGPLSKLRLAILNHDSDMLGEELNHFRVYNTEYSRVQIETLTGDIVSAADLEQYELGHKFPPLYKLIAILRALNIKL